MIIRLIRLGAATSLLLLAACQEDNPNPPPAVNAPEIVGLTVSATTVMVGESVTYSWALSEAAGATCALDIGSDGTAEYTPPCSSGSQMHTFTAAGTFSATLKVSVGEQASSEVAPVVTAEDQEDTDVIFSDIAWRPTQPIDYGVAEAQSAVVGDKFYIFGGFDSRSPYGCCRPTDRAFSFDPATETWAALAPLPPMNGTEYGGLNHGGFTTDGEDIFFAGGHTSNGKNTQHIFGTAEVWRYNVADDSYTRLPDLPEARGSGVMEYFDGKLYFFGGSVLGRKTDTGELFILDLSTEGATWSEGETMPNPRNHLASAVLNGLIYAVGGQHDHDSKLTTQADVHTYDPETDTWAQVSSLPKAISHHTNSTFVVGGRIIVLGGEVDHLKGIDDVVAYDPETDVWSELTPMPVAAVDPVAGYVGGEIVVTKGWKTKAFIGTPLE